MVSIVYQILARVTRPDGLTSSNATGLLHVEANENTLRTGNGSAIIYGEFDCAAPMLGIGAHREILPRTVVTVRNYEVRADLDTDKATAAILAVLHKSWGRLLKIEATVAPKTALRLVYPEITAIGSGMRVGTVDPVTPEPDAPTPGPGSGPASPLLLTDFLDAKNSTTWAETSTLFFLSDRHDDAWRAAAVAKLVARGSNAICVHAYSDRDGGGAFPAVYAPGRKEQWRSRLQVATRAGLRVLMFIIDDDSGALRSAGVNVWQNRILDLHRDLGDLVEHFILVLEWGEFKDVEKLQQIGAAAKQIIGSKPLWIHTNGTGARGDWSQISAQDWPCIDGVHIQTGFRLSASTIRTLTKQAGARMKKPWTIWEYTLSREYFLGDAALEEGVKWPLFRGVGNGFSKVPAVTPVTPGTPDESMIDWSLKSWPITTTLESVIIGDGKIRYQADLSSFQDFEERKTVCATNWIGRPIGGGRFEMISFEFMQRGNMVREMASIDRDHTGTDWKPVSGQIYPFGLANGGRHGKHMYKRRASIAWARWP
jgi:hypothetical protein